MQELFNMWVNIWTIIFFFKIYNFQRLLLSVFVVSKMFLLSLLPGLNCSIDKLLLVRCKILEPNLGPDLKKNYVKNFIMLLQIWLWSLTFVVPITWTLDWVTLGASEWYGSEFFCFNMQKLISCMPSTIQRIRIKLFIMFRMFELSSCISR